MRDEANRKSHGMPVSRLTCFRAVVAWKRNLSSLTFLYGLLDGTVRRGFFSFGFALRAVDDQFNGNIGAGCLWFGSLFGSHQRGTIIGCRAGEPLLELLFVGAMKN